MRVARQGIWIGIGLSFIAMVLAALGYIPPFIGALLQEGIDIVVIINALRSGKLPQTREKEHASSLPVPSLVS
jgi:cation transport ATPase